MPYGAQMLQQPQDQYLADIPPPPSTNKVQHYGDETVDDSQTPISQEIQVVEKDEG